MNKTFKKITTVIIFIFIICCQFTSVFAIDEEKSNFQTHTAYDGIIVKNTKVLQPDFSDKINAKSYCLIELKTGRIITAKNENDPLPVASTTKIMTSYLTAKSTYLDQYFTVDDNAVIVEGTSMGLKPGYQVSLRGLLVGMLLKSGNDGANAAAVKVGSTNENFIKMMNDTAIKIGMKNTKFTTASGLDYGNPYSTAYDMALLTRVAINQPEVAEICSQTSLKTMVGNPLINVKYTGHNRILTEYDGGIGVKTGYTIKSGKCLVSAAKRNDITLICVSLSTNDDVISVHSKLLDFGFEQLKNTQMDDVNVPQSVLLTNGTTETISIKHEVPSLPLLENEKQDITSEYYLNEAVAPCYENQVAGEIVYKLNGEDIIKAPIIYSQTVYEKEKPIPPKGFFQWIKSLFS